MAFLTFLIVADQWMYALLFDRLCWQENVHVIVMLTREVESALVKCGNYWNEGQYGPLRLKLVSNSDTPERERRRRESEMSSGFFNVPQARAAAKDEQEEPTIRRVFELTHTGHPDAPPRVITQLQYLNWPDLDVPKDPRGLLQLMQEVDDAVESSRSSGEKIWGEGPLRPKPGAKRPQPASQDESVAIGSERDWDDLDARTGIAKHAIDNPPVLLHCSAGVGRTGGFIAVDAILDGVRREMRKRREEKEALEKMSSGTGSPMPSTGHDSSIPVFGDGDDAMDVDVRSFASVPPSPKDAALPVTGDRHSMSASVGGGDLPSAGSSSRQEPMDVDVDMSVKGAHISSESRRVLQPSTDLIDEVRLANLRRLSSSRTVHGHDFASAPSLSIQSPAPHVLSLHGNISDTGSSGSLTSSGRRSTSTSGLTSESRMGTSPVSNSATGSTTSLDAAMKLTEVREEPKLLSYSESTAATAGSMPATNAAVRASQVSSEGKNQRVLEHARLDSWRSNVSDLGRYHTADAQPNPQKLEDDDMPPTPRTMVFDYTAPRRLHDDTSPLLLSTYDEPIRRVVEDMREQRMSLCQSLRQYVFVHRAIIEGALMIVDEEKRREEEDRLAAKQEAVSTGTGAIAASEARSAQMSDAQAPKAQSPAARRASFAHGLDKAKEHMFSLHQPVPRTAPTADVHMDEVSHLQPPALPSPRSKRQASPTELVQETLKGEARLSKRPSVKRKARSSDEEEGGLTLSSMVLSSPPPPDKH